MANLFSPPTSNDVAKGSRFGRNGTRDSALASLNGDGQPTPRFRWSGGVARVWDRYMSLPNPFWAKAHPDSVDDSDENGVYAITKKTDYWFNREAYQIEQEAKQLAAEWAEKGLPRHDV